MCKLLISKLPQSLVVERVRSLDLKDDYRIREDSKLAQDLVVVNVDTRDEGIVSNGSPSLT
jgi:hypothetical protein